MLYFSCYVCLIQMFVVLFLFCSVFYFVCFFFFFKQKTAYEMRISDWSSDVCCSDLPACLLQSAIFHALIANQPDDTETNTDRSHCNAENVDLEGYDIQTVPNRLACRYRLYV